MTALDVKVRWWQKLWPKQRNSRGKRPGWFIAVGFAVLPVLRLLIHMVDILDNIGLPGQLSV
jgi:predicted component of type VI protein secretion system